MADAMLAFFKSWGLLVAVWVVIVSVWVMVWWLTRRDRRQWDARFAADRRRSELQRQLWQMEEQIREERLSDEEREWRRRRLGLPEEDAPSCRERPGPIGAHLEHARSGYPRKTWVAGYDVLVKLKMNDLLGQEGVRMSVAAGGNA